MQSFSLAQIENLSIQAFDASQNPLSGITFDAPPVWTNSNSAAANLVTSPDGTGGVLTSLAPGQTTLGVTALIGGVSFTASVSLTVTQTGVGAVATIQIIATPAPKPAS